MCLQDLCLLSQRLTATSTTGGTLFLLLEFRFFVKLILVPIEIFGILLKPTILMIRLTANISAGHIIILSFVSLIFIFGANSQSGGMGVGVFSTLFMIFMYFLELLVAFLQAYVFTLLAAIYFSEATQEPHH